MKFGEERRGGKTETQSQERENTLQDMSSKQFGQPGPRNGVSHTQQSTMPKFDSSTFGDEFV